MKCLIRGALVVVVFLAGLILLWYLGVPEEFIESRMEALVGEALTDSTGRNIKVELYGLSKGLLFSVAVSRAELFLEGFSDPIIELYEMNIKPKPQRLFAGQIEAVLEGRLTPDSGDLSLELRRNSGGYTGFIVLKEVPLQKLFIFQQSGLKGSARLSAKGTFQVKKHLAEGTVVFRIEDMKIADLYRDGLYLPLSLFKEATGAIELKPGILRITSVSLQARGIYSRLKGQITGERFAGVLEIMTEPDVPEVMLAQIKRYRVSPGYYRIPVTLNLFSR